MVSEYINQMNIVISLSEPLVAKSHNWFHTHRCHTTKEKEEKEAQSTTRTPHLILGSSNPYTNQETIRTKQQLSYGIISRNIHRNH